MRPTRLDTDALKSTLANDSRWAHQCGARVAARRNALGLSVRYVADYIGTTVQYVHMIEAGKRVPADHLRLALAHALACDISDLYPLPTRDEVAEYVEPAA